MEVLLELLDELLGIVGHQLVEEVSICRGGRLSIRTLRRSESTFGNNVGVTGLSIFHFVKLGWAMNSYLSETLNEL